MKHSGLMRWLRAAAVFTALLTGTHQVFAALTDISPAPLGTAPTATVLPNLMFVLDDSGSMAREYTPDQVNDNNTCKSCTGSTSSTCAMTNDACEAGHPPYYAAPFNFQYYNPKVTYKPGVNYLGTSLGNSPATAAPNDPYISGQGTKNLVTSYRDIWWCNISSPSSSDFNNTSVCRRNGIGAGSSNPFDWTLNTVGNGYPNATGTTSSTFRYQFNRDVSNPFYYVIEPTEHCSDTSMTVCVAATAPSVSHPFPAPMRWCRTTASTSAAAPVSGGSPATCRATVDGTYRYPRFGTFRRYDIMTGSNYPRASSRTDCAGAVGATGCNYNEELQNFANWYSYYRTRMLQMKSISGNVFSKLDDRYRIGFLTINASSTSKYLPINKFETTPTTQKQDWFTKFYSQTPNSSTPLRQALSRVGRHYAGRTDGINSFMPQDPVQFSCQRNYTLLTTDGYWNGAGGQYIDGTAMGNEDNVTGPFVSRATVTLDATGSTSTVVTPKVTLRQQICVGNANTTFPADNTACGCSGNNSKVIQQTRSDNDNVIFNSSGTQTGTSTNTTFTYQDITACTAPYIETTVTQTTRIDEELVQGTAMSTFVTVNGVSAGSNQAGTCAANQGRIKRRSTTYDATIVTTAGSPAPPTFSNTVYTSFVDIGACITLATTQTVTRVTEVAEWSGRGPSTSPPQSAFSAALSGINPQTTVNTRCSKSSEAQRWRRTVVYDKTDTQTGNGPITTTYTAVGAPAFVRLNACSNSTPNAANTVVTSSTPVVTTSGGPNPVAASSTVTDGTSTTTNNGATPLTIPLSPNPSAQTTGATYTTFGGATDTLADAAMYYYKTDLRPSLTNNVRGPDGVPNFHQNMTTFTLGLGLDGQMIYDPNYETATSGDFYNIKTAATNCTWSTGTCNWPVPVADDPTAIDDLWHAAVNGRGKYFSAKDPTALETGLTSTLNSINQQRGAAAAAATSTAFLTSADNLEFKGEYRTQKWDGEITAARLDEVTGNQVDILWTVRDPLNARTTPSADTRLIYKFDSLQATKLTPFLYANLTPTEQAFFNNKCVAPGWFQCGPMDAGRITNANLGTNLVNWLRGQRGDELSPDASTGFYRTRDYILGDIVNSQPVFVGPPNQAYADVVTPTYATFKTAQASRQKVLYVAANDGMLHAINADTGAEMWAYVPKIVMPNLWKLANSAYDNNHIYTVDGTPTVTDMFFPDAPGSTTGAWKTILVGGLNSGGRGYFALDITNPDPAVSGGGPKGLWEICADAALCDVADVDMGLTFGNPIIARRFDGKPIVFVTSGYNNVSTGNGGGYLYSLDLATGAVLQKIGTEAPAGTNVGSAGTPSGLSKISGYWVNRSQNNTPTRIYGGDLLGNMWRFDLSTVSPVVPITVARIARLFDGSGTPRPQPITTSPEITRFNAGYNLVYIGTGRFLGKDDSQDPATLTPAQTTAYQQSIYAFKDTDTPVDLGNLRLAGANMVQQTLSVVSGTTSRTISSNPVDLSAKNGWYVDLNPGNVSPGERINLNPQLVRGVLVVIANEPNTLACSEGGNSYFYTFDYRTGSYIPGTTGNVVGGLIDSSLAVGGAIFQTQTGVQDRVRLNTGEEKQLPIPPGGAATSGQRVSWRELVQ